MILQTSDAAALSKERRPLSTRASTAEGRLVADGNEPFRRAEARPASRIAGSEERHRSGGACDGSKGVRSGGAMPLRAGEGPP
jgi:hypothetical protein